MVIIAGTLIYIDESGEKTRLGPGSYCHIPAGVKHITRCAENANCLFCEDQSGKYDIRPAIWRRPQSLLQGSTSFSGVEPF